MKPIDDFKLFWGTKVLDEEVGRKRRELKICNVNDAKTIGIIYNADQIISYEIIKNFIKELTAGGANVSAIGYVQSKNLIDHYLYRKGFDFFTKRQLNWYNKPVNNDVKGFVQKPFDILINLSLEKLYPIEYIVAVSNAKFKVGRFLSGPNYLDLMIDIEKEIKTMFDLQNEIKSDRKINGKQTMDFETEVKPKIEIEIQLNFMINQIMHYLSIIKNN